MYCVRNDVQLFVDFYWLLLIFHWLSILGDRVIDDVNSRTLKCRDLPSVVFYF